MLNAHASSDAIATLLAGGSVRKYTLYGFIQQWLWPALMTDRLMPSMFGLASLATWLKDGQASDSDKSR